MQIVLNGVGALTFGYISHGHFVDGREVAAIASGVAAAVFAVAMILSLWKRRPIPG